MSYRKIHMHVFVYSDKFVQLSSSAFLEDSVLLIP